MKGKLIVIEGSEASGKETQSELLIRKLKKQGYKTAYFDFPVYNSKTGKKIANYLKGDYGGIEDVSPYFASLLYADDRFALRDKIAKRLKEGRIVVINRYVLSNKAHQSVKIKDKKERENFFSWIDELEYKKNRLPMEDVLIYLYVPVDIIVELIKQKGKKPYLKGKKDIHESNIEYIKKVEGKYVELAAGNRKYITVNCLKNNKLLSVEEIHKKIWKILSEKSLKK